MPQRARGSATAARLPHLISSGRVYAPERFDHERSSNPMSEPSSVDEDLKVIPMLVRGKRLVAAPAHTLDDALREYELREATARALRTGEAARRWSILAKWAPEIIDHVEAMNLPPVVNDVHRIGRDPSYELENSSYCAIAAALRRASGAIAEEVTGNARHQAASSWAMGSLSLEAQYRGITDFLLSHAPELENHIHEKTSVADAMRKMASYPEGTRFVAHFSAPEISSDLRESHFLYGERLARSLLLVDFQTNISPETRPILFLDEPPSARHYARFNQASFWGLPTPR